MDDLGVAVVIEDDADVRGLLEAVLVQAGFEVHTAGGGREGVETVRQAQATVVTLDVGLPDIDGFEVLRRIRQFSQAYVLMLTGRAEEPDLLTAFHGGADDYLTKPFRPLELPARISAMTRRNRTEAPESLAPMEQPEPPVGEVRGLLSRDGLTLNVANRTAAIDGALVELTRSEFDLLHELMCAGGAVRSRSELVRVVRGDDSDDPYISEADERAVEVHVGNLRRKLQDTAEAPRRLLTVRGVGYRLAPGTPD